MAYPIDPTSAEFAPFVGTYLTNNPVADSDDLYVSAEGIAIRRWKNRAGTRFWDELLFPFSPQDPESVYTDSTAPLGGVGAQYPEYTAADGGLVTVSVAPSSVDEDGTPNLIFTFSRNAASRGTLTIFYSITGTAVNGVDYELLGPSFMISFEGNALTTTLNVNPIADVDVEADKTVIVTVLPNEAYTVGSPSSATGTITNDDA